MADAVQIKLVLENAQLSKQLADTERKFQKLEYNAKKSAKGMSDAFSNAFENMASRSPLAGLTAGLGPLGVAIGVATGAMGALLAATIAVAKSVSDLKDQANALGVSFQNLQELQFIANQSGVSVDELSSSLSKLEKSLVDIGTGGAPEAAEALAKLGITIEQFESLDVADQLKLLADRMSKLKTQAEFTSVGTALFGKGLVTIAPLLKTSSDDVAELEKQFKDLGLAISDVDQKQLSKFNNNVELINTSIKKLMAEALTPVAELLNSTVNIALNKNEVSWKDAAQAIYDYGLTFKGLRAAFGENVDDALVEPPSVANAGEIQQGVDRRRKASMDAYEREANEWLELNKKLAADDAKRAAVLAKDITAVNSKEIDIRKAKLEEYYDFHAKLRYESYQGFRKDLDTLSDESIEDLTIDINTDDMDKAVNSFDAMASLMKDVEAVSGQAAFAIGDAFLSIIDGSQRSSEAVKNLLKSVADLILQMLILRAIEAGMNSMFPSSASASGSGGSSNGLSVRVFNYGSAPGGVQVRQGANGQTDIILGSIAQAITRGGNPLSQALQRTYGLGRVGS